MENPSFRLEGIVREKDELQDFEGPLNLILMLLAKNKIEIRDLKISDILDQYLEYLAKMQEMNLEIASEFVQMASHLVYLKTKMLLAGEKEVNELDVLIETLEQMKGKKILSSIKEVVPDIKKLTDIGLLYFTKIPGPYPQASAETRYRYEPVELLSVLFGMFNAPKSVIGEANEEVRFIPQKIQYSVRDKSREILEKLQYGDLTLQFLYERCDSKSEIVATFVSVLELCSSGNIAVMAGSESVVLSYVSGNIDEIINGITE